MSVRKVGEEKFGTKVEIKNINSFRFVEKAIEFEIERQIDAVLSGEKIIQETRLYDPDKNRTVSMRTKEDAQDYRYFPDPDLLPLVLTDDFIEGIRKSLPELPIARAQRFQTSYQLPEYDAHVLTAEKELADYYEKVSEVSKNPKAASNWVMSELLRELNREEKNITECKLKAEYLGQLIRLIDAGTISGKIAKAVFIDMWSSGQPPEKIVKDKGLVQISDTSAVEKIIDEVLAANPSQVTDYKGGRTKLLGFFVGQIMKASKGQANPDVVNKILMEKLK